MPTWRRYGMLAAALEANARWERAAAELRADNGRLREHLPSWPARQGQQRSLRRMCQVLSWALARSPGERSFACALLAAFWDSGLFLPRYGIFAHVLP